MKDADVLELVSVSKIYHLGQHRVHALDSVSLVIRKGEFVAITGPSGSGKSSLLYLVGLLDTPTTGTVLLEGRDVSKLSEEDLARTRNKKIGFIFQQYNLLERASALDNVGLPLVYSGEPQQVVRDKSREALIQVGLLDRLSHYPNQLSGGQQQRVAIARAIVTNPSIVLADEPTGNLDTKTGAEIMDILKQLNKKGSTVVIVTHESDIAKRTKRIIRLRDGKIVS